MNTRTLIECIGYFGSALVVVSMLMTSVVRLRIINTIGSVIFATYAFIIHSYPTVLMNLCLVAINVYQLIRLMRTDVEYSLVKTAVDDGYVTYLLDTSEADIKSFFPDFTRKGLASDVAYVILCGQTPAGLFLGNRKGADGLEIVLDYATPQYRDTSVGKFLYERLKALGCRELVYTGKDPKHTEYLNKTGFVMNNAGQYVKKL